LNDDAIREIVRSWAKDPRKFVLEALRIEQRGPGYKISAQQEEGLEAARKMVLARTKASRGEKLTEEEKTLNRKIGISVMSGQGSGKDALCSWLILWFLVCYFNPKIIATANTGNQLRDVLWAEISKWMRGSLIEDLLTWQAEKVFLKEVKRPGSEWFAVARTINTKASDDEQAETLAGRHEDYMMFVIDEASGIPPAVFRPIEGGMTGICNFVLMVFNPTRRGGFAVDSQTKHRKDWVCLQWNTENSDLVSRESILRLKEKYGIDSNTYRVRVKGLPPLADEDTLIPWDWVMAAVDKEMIVPKDAPLVLGVDVGGGGDESVVLHRHGHKVDRIITKNSDDTMEICGWTAKEQDDYEPDATYVDNIGLGMGVYDRLREVGRQRTFAVDVRNVANNKEKFYQLRDELWWRMREAFEGGSISIPNDEKLIDQLSDIKYETRSDGRIKVESKKELRRRGKESPNRADALMQTFKMRIGAFRQSPKDAYMDAYNDFYTQSQTSWMAA
jgi:hypothetical protein